MKEQKKGISLIVLVITIIVMIILASAVIISLSNSNIITKAKEAVDKTNEKALQQQADLYEAELKLEFRELGINNIIFSEHAKEVYKNAIKEGKTDQEAKVLAKEALVGLSADWTTDGSTVYTHFMGNVDYTPMYREVERVVQELTSARDGSVVKIDETIIPEDLCVNLELYRAKWAEFAAGTVTRAEVLSYYKTLDPLYGFLNVEYGNKYFYDVANVICPYYFYEDDTKQNILKLSDYELGGQPIAGPLDPLDITVLTLDDNYTILDAWNGDASIFGYVNENCKIILPKTLKRINERAFAYIGVYSLEIPSSVEYIDERAFGEASNHMLTELIIKKEEGSIPGEPWGLDTSVTTITWQP